LRLPYRTVNIWPTLYSYVYNGTYSSQRVVNDATAWNVYRLRVANSGTVSVLNVAYTIGPVEHTGCHREQRLQAQTVASDSALSLRLKSENHD